MGDGGERRFDTDWVVIGSGFGGSVSALRLAQKGYRVHVIEKGKRWEAQDFPSTNWNIRRWLWIPLIRCFGFFRISLFRHITVLSGVGVGGGSLVYANTLPEPDPRFYRGPSWRHLADWERELAPYFPLARRMLNTAPNPRLETGDQVLREIARALGREEGFRPTSVGIWFGEEGTAVPDPYFGGQGPQRKGCVFCGACMTGCRHEAKNTLDKNYLWLAERLGVEIQPESEVTDVRPLGGEDGSDGYEVRWRQSTRWTGSGGSLTTRGVVFAGGVLGTVPLLLRLRESSLPRLSDRVGRGVRTNSESLVGVTTFDHRTRFSEGVAIGSILDLGEGSHLEPVRYGEGSGFWRLLMSPLAHGRSTLERLARAFWDLLRHPIRNLRAFFVWDWAKRTQILLFMRTMDGTLRLRRGRFRLKTAHERGEIPTAYVPDARQLAEHFAGKVDGKPMALATETLLGIPTTAHILGGACMGADASEGVIDASNRVFGYRNMLVCDGSMITANPGVNPSLTITALSERAMDRIPPAGETA